MFGTEHMMGSFDFHTDITQDDKGNWVASALGESASHPDQSQALNDLNAKIDDKLVRGELRPDM
jgi:hypothetical protein